MPLLEAFANSSIRGWFAGLTKKLFFDATKTTINYPSAGGYSNTNSYSKNLLGYSYASSSLAAAYWYTTDGTTWTSVDTSSIDQVINGGYSRADVRMQVAVGNYYYGAVFRAYGGGGEQIRYDLVGMQRTGNTLGSPSVRVTGQTSNYRTMQLLSDGTSAAAVDWYGGGGTGTAYFNFYTLNSSGSASNTVSGSFGYNSSYGHSGGGSLYGTKYSTFSTHSGWMGGTTTRYSYVAINGSYGSVDVDDTTTNTYASVVHRFPNGYSYSGGSSLSSGSTYTAWYNSNAYNPWNSIPSTKNATSPLLSGQPGSQIFISADGLKGRLFSLGFGVWETTNFTTWTFIEEPLLYDEQSVVSMINTSDPTQEIFNLKVQNSSTQYIRAIRKLT